MAIVSDGFAVLGLGNIGAEAGSPVIAGKAIFFKVFADFPQVIIDTVRAAAPTF